MLPRSTTTPSLRSSNRSHNPVGNEILLNEIRDIKEKIKTATSLTTVKESERKFWKELVDSNIRAGTIACLWCLKAQAIKRVSSAFNKWKLFTAMKSNELVIKETAIQQKQEISTVIDNALSIIKKYKAEDYGFMNQVNLSNSWRQQQPLQTQIQPLPRPEQQSFSDLTFPWEERRNNNSHNTPLPINPATLQYINQNVSSDLLPSVSQIIEPERHENPNTTFISTQSTIPPPPPPPQASPRGPPSPRLRETMETTNKVWNFIQKQFRPTNKDILDPETERQMLCKTIFKPFIRSLTLFP